MIKKLIALMIIGGAIAFAGLLIIGKNYNPRSVKKSLPSGYSLYERENNETPPSLGKPLLTAESVPARNENITQKFAQQITQEIADQNPQPQEGLNVIEPEEIIDQYLSRGIENFDYQALKPAVDEDMLKTINNTGAQLAESYFNGVKSILEKNFGRLTIQSNDFTASNLAVLVGAYDQAISDFYNLPVPENLLDIHRREISLLGVQKKIFEYIQNYKNDPLQALLAIGAAEKVEKEFLALQETAMKIAK